MSAVGNKFYGIASATLATMRLTGQMFSMGITMLVFAVILGNNPISEAGQYASFKKYSGYIFSSSPSFVAAAYLLPQLAERFIDPREVASL